MAYVSNYELGGIFFIQSESPRKKCILESYNT